jgi:hypothetical protein
MDHNYGLPDEQYGLEDLTFHHKRNNNFIKYDMRIIQNTFQTFPGEAHIYLMIDNDSTPNNFQGGFSVGSHRTFRK